MELRQHLIPKLKALRLSGILDTLDVRTQQAVAEQWTYGDFLDSSHIAEYVEHVFNRYDFNDSGGPAIFKTFFTWTAAWFNLSMRDI